MSVQWILAWVLAVAGAVIIMNAYIASGYKELIHELKQERKLIQKEVAAWKYRAEFWEGQAKLWKSAVAGEGVSSE